MLSLSDFELLYLTLACLPSATLLTPPSAVVGLSPHAPITDKGDVLVCLTLPPCPALA